MLSSAQRTSARSLNTPIGDVGAVENDPPPEPALFPPPDELPPDEPPPEFQLLIAAASFSENTAAKSLIAAKPFPGLASTISAETPIEKS